MAEAAAPEAVSPDALVALADQCVQCGLCLPACPTYRLDASESESPRGRIAYMKAVAGAQLAPTPVGDLHLDHCLGCLRCQQACPAGVQYEPLLVGSRALQARRRPSRWLRLGRLQLLAHPPALAALLSLYQRVHRWLPARCRPLPEPPLDTSPRGPDRPPERRGQAAVFLGCMARTFEAPARAALQRLSAAAGLALDLPPHQGCCGMASAHAGASRQAATLGSANAVAFANAATVLCLASGCRGRLDSTVTAPVVDPLAWLDREAPGLRFGNAGGVRVALHLPCSQRLDPAALAATRRWLDRIPGLDWVELPDTGCCGAAGLHQFEHPARAAALREPLLEAFARTGASQLISANIGCRLHLAMATPLPVRHPLELLADHLEPGP